MTFVIYADNNITAYNSAAAPEGAELKPNEQSFSTEKELATLSGSWPGARLIEIWNTLPGATTVKKFSDRKKAVSRIWKSLQSVVPTESETEAVAQPVQNTERKATRKAPKKTPSPAKTTKSANTATGKAKKATNTKTVKQPTRSRDVSKKAVILALLQRKGGGTLAEIMSVTGWQAHSVRGFISGALGKKMGLTVESAKNDSGERTYRISE